MNKSSPVPQLPGDSTTESVEEEILEEPDEGLDLEQNQDEDEKTSTESLDSQESPTYADISSSESDELELDIETEEVSDANSSGPPIVDTFSKKSSEKSADPAPAFSNPVAQNSEAANLSTEIEFIDLNSSLAPRTLTKSAPNQVDASSEENAGRKLSTDSVKAVESTADFVETPIRDKRNSISLVDYLSKKSVLSDIVKSVNVRMVAESLDLNSALSDADDSPPELSASEAIIVSEETRLHIAEKNSELAFGKSSDRKVNLSKYTPGSPLSSILRRGEDDDEYENDETASQIQDGNESIPENLQASTTPSDFKIRVVIPATENSIIGNACLFYCFDCLITKLNSLPMPRGLDLPAIKIPLFVKWSKGTEEDLELRGCLGSFYPFLLRDGLQKFAISSATKDSRFPPIQLQEIKHLQLTVSLVRNFQDASDCLDWTIGLHGIYLRFKNEAGEIVSASFLPDVAVMNSWTQIEAIDALLRKGGFVGEITKKFRDTLKLKRFETDDIHTSYQEYKENVRTP